MCDAPAIIVFAASAERVVKKYGSRGERYVHMEIGAAAENAWLRARSLGLDAAAVGAFVDHDAATLTGLEGAEQPMLLMPVGLRGAAPAGIAVA